MHGRGPRVAATLLSPLKSSNIVETAGTRSKQKQPRLDKNGSVSANKHRACGAYRPLKIDG